MEFSINNILPVTLAIASLASNLSAKDILLEKKLTQKEKSPVHSELEGLASVKENKKSLPGKGDPTENTSYIHELKSEPKKNESVEMTKELAWKGEVRALYKGGIKIRILISIPDDGELKFREELLQKKEFVIKQKNTNKKIGTFVISEIIFEKKETGRKKIDLIPILHGTYRLTKGRKKLLTTGTQILLMKEYPVFIEPFSYFENRITKPLKSFIHPKDKKEMLLVEQGEFIFGQGFDSSSDSYNPSINSPDTSNITELPSFYMDKYEVTNGEYNTYLKETGKQIPPHWRNGSFPAGKKDHPVLFLTFRETEGYALWAGKRLPTELEWEKAALGPGIVKTIHRDESVVYEVLKRNFPFGINFEKQYCNTRESGLRDTVSVYSLPIQSGSPYGIQGMCGNAPEWTSSWYDVYPGHYLKNLSLGKQYKVIRGGSYFSSSQEARSWYRTYGGLPSLSKDRKAGFRLVVDQIP